VAAEAAFDEVFKRHEVPEDAPTVRLPADAVRDGRLWLPRVLVAAGLASSNAEARRAVEQGGVRLDGVVLRDPDADLDPEAVIGRTLQVGRRRSARIVAVEDASG